MTVLPGKGRRHSHSVQEIMGQLHRCMHARGFRAVRCPALSGAALQKYTESGWNADGYTVQMWCTGSSDLVASGLRV